jgi:hypothetical protein
LNCLPVDVGKQWHGQIVLVTEFGLPQNIVGADSQNRCTLLLDLRHGVAEPARLARSAWSVGFGEKEKHNAFVSRVILQTHLPAVIIDDRKSRSFAALFHHIPSWINERSVDCDSSRQSCSPEAELLPVCAMFRFQDSLQIRRRVPGVKASRDNILPMKPPMPRGDAVIHQPDGRTGPGIAPAKWNSCNDVEG